MRRNRGKILGAVMFVLGTTLFGAAFEFTSFTLGGLGIGLFFAGAITAAGSA